MKYFDFLINYSIYVMEPFIGNVNMDEGSYTAMQGIIHFIGWAIFIGILIWVFKYMKKHIQEDERMKKYYGQSDEKEKKE